MSIRFDEQQDGPYSLTAKRPSRQYAWQAWDPKDETWLDLGSRRSADVMARAFPDAHTEGYRIQAARYLDQILQRCDGHHALVVYRWVEQEPHPFRARGPDAKAIHIAVVRAETDFKGSRKAPEWTQLPPSALARVIGGDVPV
jgi:hypothetical protein